ncbi:MAG: DNA alkylation repair protein [Alphaproteobacteria bacterium]|nr:DNA alkylation repair protein [Alphaproteobacteria bacterium]
MSDTLNNLKKAMKAAVDSTPQKASLFFKTAKGDYAESDQFMGITVPTIRKIAKKYHSLSLDDLSLLIQSPLNEERLLALIILTAQYKRSQQNQKDARYHFYKIHMNYVNNWNLVDSSAHLIVGAHLFDQDRQYLMDLSHSQNLWERRIAIIATLYFIRKSDLDWTFKIAEQLLNDPHDLIHKAVGWMLREAGKKNETRLVNFLKEYANHMPKTMLRYATERLSSTQKTELMTTLKKGA